MTETETNIEEFVQHEGWLRQLAGSVVGEHEVDDLVQEVFLKAVRHRPQLKGPAKGWMAVVLRNSARMRFRSESRRALRDQSSGEDAVEAPLPCEEIDRRQHELILREMVSALPARYRSTVIGLYVDGLSAVELAKVQGLKPATVRQRHRSALALLRKQVDGKNRGAFSSLRNWLMTAVPAATAEMSGGICFEVCEFGLLAL